MIDYAGLAAEYARHRGAHPEVLTRLHRRGEVTGASRVLEVGCGTGNYVVALEALSGCACWGTDPHAAMLSRARARSGRVTFLEGRAERLEFPEESFDLVFSVDVIHHVGDRAAHFTEAHRVLRPGGKVCTVTDSEWIIRNREPLAVFFPETVEVDLARYPSIGELCELMRQAGFTDADEETVEFAYVLTDAQAYRDRAFSSLHLIPEEAFQRGLARMQADLCAGPIPCVSRYLMLWGTRP